MLHLDPRVKEDELKEIFGIQVGKDPWKQNHHHSSSDCPPPSSILTTLMIVSQCTNGANLHFLPGHGRGVGVYPVQANPQRSFLSQKNLNLSELVDIFAVQAFLNHSCMCNTVTLEHPGEHRVELRARWVQ